MNLAAAQPAVGIRRVPERSGRAQSAGIRVRGCVLVRWDGLVGMDLVRHAGICGDGHSKCHGQVLVRELVPVSDGRGDDQVRADDRRTSLRRPLRQELRPDDSRTGEREKGAAAARRNGN